MRRKCHYCGSWAYWGGIQNGELFYCGTRCHERGIVVRLADGVTEDMVRREVEAVHQGDCPRCRQPGPVDVHVSHRVWSALVRTDWQNHPHVCCPSCGRWQRLKDTVISLMFGWWGLPWGPILTPIQVARNALGLFRSGASEGPSEILVAVVRARLAAEQVRRQQDELSVA